MKKLIFALALVVLPTLGWSAAPSLVSYEGIDDTTTVDSAYHNGFEVVDSFIVVITDTANVIFRVTGVANMTAGEYLYFAMGNDSANRQSATNLKADTSMGVFYIGLPYEARGIWRMPFTFTWRDSLESQTDRTDTFYFNAAVRGTGGSEKIMIEDVTYTCEVMDRD